MSSIVTTQSKIESLLLVFRQYLLDYGCACEVKESDSFVTVYALHEYLAKNCVSCILGIHALRAGKLLRGLCVEPLKRYIRNFYFRTLILFIQTLALCKSFTYLLTYLCLYDIERATCYY